METKTRLVLVTLCWLWLFTLLTGLNAGLHFLPSGVLFYALALFLLIDLVFPRGGVYIKIPAVLFIVQHNHYGGSLFDPSWLGSLAGDLVGDLGTLGETGGTVQPLSAMFLSLLAAALVQKLFFALISRGKAVLFLLFVGSALLTGTFMYTGAGGPRYIIAYAVLGLMIMGTSRVQVNFSFPMGRWLGFLLIWALVITSVAWALPYGEIQLSPWWEETLSWRTVGGGKKGRVGYGSYDGAMGGPLELDDTPLLLVTSPRPVYLMGEVRWRYTGNSWSRTTDVNYFNFTPPPKVDGQEISITIKLLREMETFFYPRYCVGFKLNRRMTDFGGLIITEPLQEGESYSITVLLPWDSPELLRQLTSREADSQYLQLSAGIPQRVYTLANTITEKETNNYDKAAAIVRYLRRGRWEYSLDTEYPPKDEDFVDWFLFEADRGYCVHFSTAFVILARSVGLPARWVKGYSYGVRDIDGNFIVQNQHAHSWAEVWFDDYGWVPFEPTPGASLPTVRPGSSTTPLEPVGPDGPSNLPEPNRPDPGIEPPQKPVEPAASPSIFSPVGIAMLAVALLGLTLVIVLMKGKKVDAVKLYARLQTRLRLFGWQRKDWETPREHLDRVKELPDRLAYENFLRNFEQSAYGGQKEVKASERRQLGKGYSLFKLALHRFSNRR